METHADARLSLKSPELMIDLVENPGWSLMSAAEAMGIRDRTAREWIARRRATDATVCFIAPQRPRSSPIAPMTAGSR